MKNQNKKMDPVDEALKLLMLSENSGDAKAIDTSDQLNYITTAIYSKELSDEGAKKMIGKLYENLAVDSLGVLIENALAKVNPDINAIAGKTNLPENSIEQLKSDAIFANSIPVISLRNLLKELQIPFEKAEQAILKSFHILKSDLAFSASSMSNLRLAYRRRNSKLSSNTKSGKSDSQYLFENEEALSKYLKRLSELY
ncbi:MAG: hypothetical protein JNK50_06065 [Bacteroidia bacterium]|nr:hypothetical protein [Bacteroidia bacterium]